MWDIREFPKLRSKFLDPGGTPRCDIAYINDFPIFLLLRDLSHLDALKHNDDAEPDRAVRVSLFGD